MELSYTANQDCPREWGKVHTKVLILTLRDNKEAVLAAFAGGQTLLHERY